MQEALYSRWMEFVRRFPDAAMLPSPPDARDFALSQLRVDVEKAVPAKAMLPPIPEIMDQMSTGKCVAFAGCGIMNTLLHNKGTLPPGGLSREYLYWRCKQEDGVPTSIGTYPRVALKIMTNEGVCEERLLPFQNNHNPLPISSAMQQNASKYRIKGYARLWNVDEIKQALAAGKYIFMGTIVTQVNWMERAKETGFLDLPEGRVLGGHATWLYGYDDNIFYGRHTGYLGGINSWSKLWGEQGKFWMPYAYASWEMVDLPGWYALMEAWAVEFDEMPVPNTDVMEVEMWVGKNQANVNGVAVSIDSTNANVTPIIYSNWERTLLPVRFVAEQLGVQVQWDQATYKVTMYRDPVKVELWVNNPKARLNGRTVDIDPFNSDVKPILYANWNRVLLPVRFLAEAFRANIHWEQSTQKITIKR